MVAVEARRELYAEILFKKLQELGDIGIWSGAK
jgi:hypothetical protein